MIGCKMGPDVTPGGFGLMTTILSLSQIWQSIFTLFTDVPPVVMAATLRRS
jgi:hypothetical protein